MTEMKIFVLLEEVNRYLKGWVTRFKKTLGGKTEQSVFEEMSKPAQRKLILARVTARTIDVGHTFASNPKSIFLA